MKCLAEYSISSSFKLSSLSYWRVVVPKFHLAGHGKECHLQFNINFTNGAGRMTGKMIESGWAQSGSMATWTRKNRPFARCAILDDHWGSENWHKLCHLCKWISPFSHYPLCLLFFRDIVPQKPPEITHLEQDPACYHKKGVQVSHS
jgi:hypothetical protein